MLAKLARNYYGEKEVAGKGNNPVIMKIINESYKWVQSDEEVAWCGIFMAHICRELNLPIPKDFGLARNWLKVGKPIELEDSNENDIVVFWRKSPTSIFGHVGMPFRVTEKWVYCFGGNQSNGINIQRYARSRVLGVRRLVEPENQNSKEVVKEIIKEVVVEKPIEVEKIIYKYPIIDFFKKLFKRRK